nr:MAG TPA: hypothetical protein [Caudoviricetes sp.]
MLLKLNLQRFVRNDITCTFDSHITKLTLYGTNNTILNTLTTSGGYLYWGTAVGGCKVEVELENGYVIDNISLGSGVNINNFITDITSNSFVFLPAIENVSYLDIDITSKQSSSSTTHKLTVENETIVITVNGISVTSPYNLQNNDKIVLTQGASYLIINGTSYTTSGQTISLSDTDINVEVGSRIPGGFSITINYTETSTPTYKFKHWKKSNVVVNRTLVGEKYYYFKPYTILGLYTITTTLTNCTGASVNATNIQENGGLTLTFTANSGYELPTGVSVTNVTSYNWNKSTGVLAISKPTGDVAIEIVAVSALPQLATPTNVSVTDTTLTFDEVANATSYEVFVDNVSIGTHTMPSVISLKWKFNGTKEFIPQKSYDNSVAIGYDVYNNDTLVESNLSHVYFNDNYTYMAFGSSGYWDTTNNKYGGGNIILFKSEPSGFLLQFLQEHCEALN